MSARRIGSGTRTPPAPRTRLPIEEWTMREDQAGRGRWRGLQPLAGERVLTPDDLPGTVLRSVPGCPTLPAGGQHRYVVLDAQDHDPELPTLAYHITQLVPLDES